MKSGTKMDEQKRWQKSCRVPNIDILEETQFQHKSKGYHESECRGRVKGKSLKVRLRNHSPGDWKDYPSVHVNH